MGYTGYQNRTPREAIAAELHDCTVLAASGSWRLITYTTSGGEEVTTLAHCITDRADGWCYVKVVPASMGPGATPPATIYRRYVAMVPEPVNDYERDWREGVEQDYAAMAAKPDVRPGDAFTITATPGYRGVWSDGVPVCGRYTYLRRYWARRSDGVTVTLPKSWRKDYEYEGVTA